MFAKIGIVYQRKQTRPIRNTWHLLYNISAKVCLDMRLRSCFTKAGRLCPQVRWVVHVYSKKFICCFLKSTNNSLFECKVQ